MKLNLPNKITVARIILSIIMIVILLLPWYEIGIKMPEFMVAGEILSLKYKKSAYYGDSTKIQSVDSRR